jgi:protein-disulfide isomerase
MIEIMQLIKRNKSVFLFLLISLALLVTVTAIAASIGSSAAKRQLVIPREPDARLRTDALLGDIPQHGSVLGYRKAPVTLQFFGDLQCKQSRQVMLGALPFLIRHWVREGKLQIRFRSLETDTATAGGPPEFSAQQAAALAAGRQGRLWNFIDIFYREQGPEGVGYADDHFLGQIAVLAGVEMWRWERDRRPGAWGERLNADEGLARKEKLPSTPSFLIGPTGGSARPLRHFALEEPEVFDEAIRGLL